MFVSEPVCVAPSGDWCGEGAVWDSSGQVLYWTDINRFLIHRFDPRNGSVKTWFFDEPVTTLVLTDRDDTLAVALGSRVILWEPQTDTRRDLGFALPGWPAVRLNDGRADPQGSFWVGSMRNNVRPDGSATEASGRDGVLYRIDPDGAVSERKRDIGISNTFAWSPDKTRFYFADTLANQVWTYQYDRAEKSIADEQPFLTGFPRGKPDGSAMDSEGYLWNCRYGGACIVRVAPDGQVDRVVEMPTKNITTCTFGGSDYRTLFITTAALGTLPGDRFAGGLFTLQTDVPGLPENRFRYFESNG